MRNIYSFEKEGEIVEKKGSRFLLERDQKLSKWLLFTKN